MEHKAAATQHAEFRLDVESLGGGQGQASRWGIPLEAPEGGSPRSPKPAPLLALREVWRSLSASSRALLVLGTAQALTAATFAVVQFADDWQLLLQDTALILCSAVLTLGLLLDAFARENAYQLLASLALGALSASQLIVYLATVQGRGQGGAAAAVAVCLALQLAAAALARSAYLGFGWRMYSRIASSWRLRPAEQQRQRAAALARQRFAALARADGLLLTLMLLVAAVNAANPGGGDGQPQPLGLLVGAAAAAVPVCAGWLAACWAAACRRGRRLAMALDCAYPLCYVPPLLIMFAGASLGSQLSQPHGQAYLILYPLLFLAARTATWWATRQLSAARQLSADDDARGDAQQLLLPPELVPLARGAWLLKLPSSGSSSGPCGTASGALDAAPSGWSCSTFKADGGGAACWPGGLSWWPGRGGGGSGAAAGRQRFFQLSHDGACLRWDWNRWVLIPHVQGIQCCDGSQTISLQLLLEPDLRLRFAAAQQYGEWRQGLQLLLALLAQPEELLPSSSPTAAAAGPLAARGSESSVMAASAEASQDGRSSSSLGREVILQVAPSPRALPAASPFGQAGSSSSSRHGGWPVAADAASAPSATPLVRENSQVQRLRVCARSDSRVQLESAAQRSQAAIAAALQRQQAADGKLERQSAPAGAAAAAPLRRAATIQLIASSASGLLPELATKGVGGQGAAGPHPRRASRPSPRLQQRHSPRGAAGPGGSAVERLRYGLRRAITLPSHLWWTYGTGAAAATPGLVAAAGSAQHSSPSRQPLNDRLRPSSSSEDFTAAALVAAAEEHERQRKLEAQQQQQQQQHHQQQQAVAQDAPHHERKLTLGVWAEGALPLLDLRQSPRPQRPPGLPLSGRQHYAAGGAALGGSSAADGAGVAATGPRRSVSAGGEPLGGGGGGITVPQRSPFIHLVAFASPRPATARSGNPGQNSSPPAAAAASEQGPSSAGSGASTPYQRSAAGSPQRGSPNRQEQLQSFQRYLQHQLAAQQRGRYGPMGDSNSGSAAGTRPASTAGSPQHGSPSRQEADASLLSLPRGSPPTSAREGREGRQDGPGAAAAGATYMPNPRPHLGSITTGRSPQQQQQQFATRMQAAGQPQAELAASFLPLSTLGGSSQPMPAFDAAASSADPGSAPMSGLTSVAPHSANLLTRAESSFSSWGMPTPTTATSRTAFGLSRFNSLIPSVSHTPLASFRQHPSFATSYQQQQLAAATILAAATGRGGPGGGVAGQRHGHRDALDGGGGGFDNRGCRGHGEEGSVATSPDASPTSLIAGLGINVPVEMVDFRDLVFGKFLGEGSEGSVYAAWYQETPVAVKKTQSLMEIEMNLHAGAHDNIVGLRGLCSHGSDIYLIMELCPRGTLDVLIHKGQGSSHRLDPLKLLPIVRSMARGMLHLHTRRPAIFHRDLKPGNLFIGHGGVVKVGDLGMSRYAAQWRGQQGDGALERTLTPGVIGTAAYSAPELLNPETPDAADDRQTTAEDEERILKADVYSFGVTLFEVMERRRPFAGMDGFQIQTQWYLDPQSMRLPAVSIPDGIPPPARTIMEALAGLVESCTHWDPDQRPSFQQILAVLRAAAGGGTDSTAPPTPAASFVAPF